MTCLHSKKMITLPHASGAAALALTDAVCNCLDAFGRNAPSGDVLILERVRILGVDLKSTFEISQSLPDPACVHKSSAPTDEALLVRGAQLKRRIVMLNG